ncbi:MAG: DUF983 domain-containing protein [Hyphomicrobiaceae bacterium]|nr:DUF983 domain-containing protein [Hyphomicrobiaceae bacterium]
MGPGNAAAVDPPRQRSLPGALLRGARLRCPACGSGRLFRAFLKVAEACPVCSEPLHHHRADDAPPYFTIFIVGHVVIAGVLMLERAAAPPEWLHLAIWLPLTVVLSLALLPSIKGCLVGLQWANEMHGFGSHGEPDDDVCDPTPSRQPQSQPQSRSASI